MRLLAGAGGRTALAVGLIVLAGCGAGTAKRPTSDTRVSIGAGLKGPSGLRASVYARGLGTLHSRDGVYLIAGAGATPVKVISGLKNPLALTTLADGSVLVGDLGSGTIYRVSKA